MVLFSGFVVVCGVCVFIVWMSSIGSVFWCIMFFVILFRNKCWKL